MWVFYLRYQLLSTSIQIYNIYFICFLFHQHKRSIISGTGVAIWSNTNSKPTGRHHPWGNRLLHVCTVTSTSAIFKIHPGSRLQFCLDHLSCVKMAAF
jgi:hypothetical protein